MTTEDYLGLTDLQAGAAGWLVQHALFARMAARFPDRVRTLDSATLMADPRAAMAALANLFGLRLDAEAIVAGPAFTRHSKFGNDFGADERAGEHREAAGLHADEIDKVAIWAEAVAASAGLSLVLPAPLLGSRSFASQGVIAAQTGTQKPHSNGVAPGGRTALATRRTVEAMGPRLLGG